MSVREQLRQYWPLFGLEIRTPRLLLTPISDDHLADLMDAELDGIHAPDEMPFDFPWSTQPPAERVPNSLRHFWTLRTAMTPERWELQLAIELEGTAIGVMDVRAKNFAVVRTFETGSWIRLSEHNKGLGTEVRAAVLMLGFDHLGAVRAESAAFTDNPSSRRVSAKLGYQENGRDWRQRRTGESAESVHLLVTPDTFIRPDWGIAVSGLDECRPVLGL